MSYGSKTIAHKIGSAQDVASRAFDWAAVISDLVGTELKTEVFEQETLPNIELLLQLIGRRIAGIAERMRELHEKHHHQRALEVAGNTQARAAAVVLRHRLRDVRFLFDRHFGVRQGVADFEGRHDLMRLPMYALDRVCTGLLNVLADDRFGWSGSRFAEEAKWVRIGLEGELATFRAAMKACTECRNARAHAAAARERGIAACEEDLKRMTNWLRELCFGAGLEREAKEIYIRRGPASQRRRPRRAQAAAEPLGSSPGTKSTRHALAALPPTEKRSRRWHRKRRRQLPPARQASPPFG